MRFICSCRRHVANQTACGERRQLLGLVLMGTLAAATGLTACGERADGGLTLVPLEIDAATTCELDGMLLADYPGPKAQIFYAGQPTPAFFCDTVELFNTLLRPEQVRQVLAAYVQDMGQANWEQPRGHWIDVKSGFYVLGSKRHGSMGPTIASFASDTAAQSFIAQYGGKLLRYDEVKPEMVDLSGGALHDTRM